MTWQKVQYQVRYCFIVGAQTVLDISNHIVPLFGILTVPFAFLHLQQRIKTVCYYADWSVCCPVLFDKVQTLTLLLQKLKSRWFCRRSNGGPFVLLLVLLLVHRIAAKEAVSPMLDHGSLKAAVDVLCVDPQGGRVDFHVIAGQRAQVCLRDSGA